MTNIENNESMVLSSPSGDRHTSTEGLKIFLIGFMGCGKTHWGKQLAGKLKIPFYDLDRLVEEKEGKTITEIFDHNGEEHFRLLEKEVLQATTEMNSSFVMSTGGGTPCYFNSIDYMKRNGVVVWINTSVDTMMERLSKEKEQRPLIRSLSDDQLRSYIIKKNADRNIYYKQASVIVKEDNFTLDQLINTIFHK
jgi:shikimate kinase